MLDLVCLLTGYLLSKHFSVCNTDKKREKQQKRKRMSLSLGGIEIVFPFFSLIAYGGKKKKKNPCQSASHFETRKKRKERKEG